LVAVHDLVKRLENLLFGKGRLSCVLGFHLIGEGTAIAVLHENVEISFAKTLQWQDSHKVSIFGQVFQNINFPPDRFFILLILVRDDLNCKLLILSVLFKSFENSAKCASTELNVK
jgi:hypothetical protein